jgi:hypothetical protein
MKIISPHSISRNPPSKENVMSFGTATRFLEEQGVDNETATDAQRAQALIKAFWQELPRGMAFLEQLSNKAKAANDSVMQLEGYDEELVGQLTRLVGHTVPRQLCEQHFGVQLDSYNCHYPVATPPERKPKLSLKTQIDLQNGRLASVDC